MSQNEEGMVPLGKERVKSHGVTPREEGERGIINPTWTLSGECKYQKV